MPVAQEEFQKAVATVLEVVMFENWLRFYFIHEKRDADGKEILVIELPEKSRERIKELYPGLYPLAQQLAGKPLDFETSRNSVLQYIMNEIEDKQLPKGETQKTLQSASFQVKLQLFHTWEQMHEDQLDNGFMEFGAWRNLFAQWLETPGAKELGKKLLQTG